MKAEIIKIWRTPYSALIPENHLLEVRQKHPDKEISVHFNTGMLLDDLERNESVCWGDGKHYVFILTEK